MNIKIERQFQIDIAADELSKRLRKWAENAGFFCTSERPQFWCYRRGNSFSALYTFDIRKIPTEVSISVVSENPLQVHCSFHVKTLCQIALPGDPKRVTEQMDLLVSHLKGALG